jgi:hypothetical protein
VNADPEQDRPTGAESTPRERGATGGGNSSGRGRSRLLLLAAAAIILAVALYNALLGRSLGTQEVHLFGQDRWTPGLPASIRVVLLRHTDQRPIADASVRVLLSRPRAEIVELATGRTDAAGTIEPVFTVPEGEGPARLLVIAESPWGRDFVDRPIRLTPAYRILLRSDRPAYRTGQRVRLHVGVSHAGTGDPASDCTVSLRAFAPGGIPFATRSARANERGGAEAEFEIAPGAPAGTYRFKAAAGASAVELAVPVLAGPQPAFPVWLGELSRYAMPGGLIRGYVAAEDGLGGYLRGASARVWLENAGGRTVSWTSGHLDLQGRLTFGLPAPPADELTVLRLYAEVTDSRLRTARAMDAVAITPHPIQLAAVPEAGALVPGVENRVYIAARYPDGAPARATVRYALGGKTGKAETSALGVASLTLVPDDAQIPIALTASDAQGRVGVYQATLPVARISPTALAIREKLRVLNGRPDRGRITSPILIRPDRGLYRPGDTLRVEVLSPELEGTLYVDGEAGGQMVFARSVRVESGRASLQLRLPDGVLGTTRIRAYALGAWGDLPYAERAIFVRPAATPRPSVQPSQPAYEPGQSAEVTLHGGEPGILGLQLARAEGERPLSEPTLGVPGVFLAPLRPGVPGAMAGAEEAAWQHAGEDERQEAALAALALVPRLEGWSLHEDTYAHKRAHLQERRAASWAWLRWLVLLLLAGLWLLAARLFPHPERSGGRSNGADSAIASTGRFVIPAIVVALAATLLFRLAGPEPVSRRPDRAHSLSAALQEERKREAQALARQMPVLPPIVPASVPVPEIALWELGARPGARAQERRAIVIPREAGQWHLFADLLSGRDAPARAAVPLRVETDLAVEFRPPAIARPGDAISVSVRVRNPYAAAQTARLKLMAGPGAIVIGEPILSEALPGGAGITRHFRVSLLGNSGRVFLTLTATGRRRTVTLRREIEILPASREATVTHAGQVTGAVSRTLDLPEGVHQATLSLQPSPGAIAATRLRSLPEELALSTLERAAGLDIARMAAASQQGNAGAEQALERRFLALLACLHESGAFASRPGDRPDVVSTAYAVAVLEAAQEAVPGAQRVARVARRWLQQQRRSTAGWPSPWGKTAADAALVAWALGLDTPPSRDLRARYRMEGSRWKNPYLLSLTALGIGGEPERSDADPQAPPGPGPSLLRRIADQAVAASVGQKWLSSEQTIQGLDGEASATEATALAVLALAPHAEHRERAEGGALYLASTRQPDGGWGNLLNTALALRALASVAPEKPALGAVEVSLNGKKVARLDANQLSVELHSHLRPGQNTLALNAEGTTGAYYELRLALPDPSATRDRAPALATNIQPRRASPGQSVTFSARLAPETSGPLSLEVPIPAGFQPVRSDLEELVRRREIAGYHVNAQRAWIQVEPGRRKQARWIAFRMVAPARCEVIAPAASIYPAANPGERRFGRPLRLTVE